MVPLKKQKQDNELSHNSSLSNSNSYHDSSEFYLLYEPGTEL